MQNCKNLSPVPNYHGSEAFPSQLLHALNIPRITDIVDRNVCSLFNRICNVNSPSRNMLYVLLSPAMAKPLGGHRNARRPSVRPSVRHKAC